MLVFHNFSAAARPRAWPRRVTSPSAFTGAQSSTLRRVPVSYHLIVSQWEVRSDDPPTGPMSGPNWLLIFAR